MGTLTTNPQLIASGACYIQSTSGEFHYAFGETISPLATDISFTDSKVYTDGSLGNLWSWKTTTRSIYIGDSMNNTDISLRTL